MILYYSECVLKDIFWCKGNRKQQNNFWGVIKIEREIARRLFASHIKRKYERWRKWSSILEGEVSFTA